MIIVQDRLTGIHLAGGSKKYTLCGKIINQCNVVNTLQINCPVPGACKKCNHWLKVRIGYLSKDFRYYKGYLNEDLENNYSSIKYYDTLLYKFDKSDTKIYKYKRKLVR